MEYACETNLVPAYIRLMALQQRRPNLCDGVGILVVARFRHLDSPALRMSLLSSFDLTASHAFVASHSSLPQQQVICL